MKKENFIFNLIGVFLGFFLIYQNLDFLLNDNYSSFLLNGAFMLAFFGLSFIIQIFIHELGHLFFGLIAGYHFVSFRIFSLTLTQTKLGLKWQRVRLKHSAGQCLMTPSNQKTTICQSVLYLAGGGLFNIILPFFILLIFKGHKNFNSYWQIFLISGILSAALNLIPNSGTLIPNDGKNIKDLINQPKNNDLFNQSLWMNEQLYQQAFYKDFKQLKFHSIENYQSFFYATDFLFYLNQKIEEENYSDYKNHLFQAYSYLPNYQKEVLFYNLEIEKILEEKSNYKLPDYDSENNSLQQNLFFYAYQLLVDLKKEDNIKNLEDRLHKNISQLPILADQKVQRNLMNRIKAKSHEFTNSL